MQEDGYRAYLMHRLSKKTSSSYMSYAKRVQRTLGIDLDDVVWTDVAIEDLARRVSGAGLSKANTSNCRSALKRYAAFKNDSGTPRQRVSSATVTPLVTQAFAARSTPKVEDLSVPQLMRLYAEVLGELRQRNVTRTANGPVGDYAEMLFQHAFGWKLAANSAAGHDALDLVGTRYQIKARRGLGSPGSRQLGELRRLPDKTFDVLAAILFDADVAVVRAVLIPHAAVMAHARRVEHTNGWRLILSDKLCLHPEVVDVTKAIQAAVSA